MICKLNARAAQARNARATLLHLHCCTARMMHGLCLTGGTMRGGRHGVAACGVREALEVHSVCLVRRRVQIGGVVHVSLERFTNPDEISKKHCSDLLS